ncbi:ABC-2 type transport system permease protein [Arthrobacter pigmenti]|uniref:Transport permease protein n=1 Tax=Arthrobacter pigmenti TaxID=271432 RepID=A0A846RYB1_9MICC|nr:ABC transporter permease [Arthrobacter pigmenti]NJC23191.1 ABC-2 type transport system permease protein [Arthrobacter pigmenti]
MSTLQDARGPSASTPWKPNALVLGWRRTLLETRMFSRDPMSLVFTLFFPLIMMGLFSTVFGSEASMGDPARPESLLTPAEYYLPGMLALGTILSGFQNLSGYVATERFNGSIKRLAGTPLPSVSYFLGKTGVTAFLILTQSALLLLGARFLFGVELPTTVSAWLTFAWLLLGSTAAWSAVGIVFACLAKSGQGASTMSAVPPLLLSFISGVYFPFSQIPDWLRAIADLTPLRWTASGMRSVFLPAGWETVEPGGIWNLGMAAVVIGVWLVAGLVLARLFFRWPPQK